jgi:hypothetical protein
MVWQEFFGNNANFFAVIREDGVALLLLSRLPASRKGSRDVAVFLLFLFFSD